MILDDYGLFIVMFLRIIVKGGEKKIKQLFGACMPLFLLFQQLLQSIKKSQIIASDHTDKHRKLLCQHNWKLLFYET